MMARALALLVSMTLPCAALNGPNWKILSASRPAAADVPGQQVELDAGIDSVVMMQTVATPFNEANNFAHFGFDDDVDDKVVLTAPWADEDL